MRDVSHMQNNVGLDPHFERGAEGRDHPVG
jgi:hypothetical protein